MGHSQVKAMPPASLQKDLSTGFKSAPPLMSCVTRSQVRDLPEPHLHVSNGENRCSYHYLWGCIRRK